MLHILPSSSFGLFNETVSSASMFELCICQHRQQLFLPNLHTFSLLSPQLVRIQLGAALLKCFLVCQLFFCLETMERISSPLVQTVQGATETSSISIARNTSQPYMNVMTCSNDDPERREAAIKSMRKRNIFSRARDAVIRLCDK